MTQMLHIHDRLREVILAHDLAPGELRTERFPGSASRGHRTPLRAAPLRLKAEDLVGHDDRKWQLTPIDFGEALDSTAVRATCARTRPISLAPAPCSRRAAAPARARSVTTPARTLAWSWRGFLEIRSC
jgi:DNA-binding GntR family transcriptional regulator